MLDHISMAMPSFLEYTMHFYRFTRSMIEQERVQRGSVEMHDTFMLQTAMST